jgi:hypothetical protein
MSKLKVNFFIVTFLVSTLSLFPPFVLKVAARDVAAGGPRDGGADVVNTPRGGEAIGVEGPRGGEAAVVDTPRGGDTAVVEGPRGNIAVGTRVYAPPFSANIVDVGGSTYYVDGDVYYRADGDGYVVVPAPR